MTETSVIGIDLAKSVFQVHGAAADGATLFRRRLSRPQLERFMAEQPACIVAMEACASAHHWARRMMALGHEVRLIAPIYVKPFVKRQKTDAADAEAIVEAAMRPSMRVVAPKSAEAQSRAMLFRAREQLIKQRTETVNAARAATSRSSGSSRRQGIGHVPRLAALVEDEARELPELARLHLGRIERLSDEIDQLMGKVRAVSAASDTARLLRTMPGVGPICAMATLAFVSDLALFARGRDFAAWLGLAPREHSSGGKQRLGRTSKMGEPRRAPPADHRRHEPHRERAAASTSRRAVARRQARAQAAHGRGDR